METMYVPVFKSAVGLSMNIDRCPGWKPPPSPD
jgi:hypothetical protein